MTTFIELLAPARDLTTGLEAIRHGADAIYIGAERFGARASAGNSIEDIAELCHQAHVYGVKIYVTINTILRDDELEDTRKLIWQLYEIGVDALIVQDMALLKMDLPPIPLHASTQMDNRTADKVKWLKSWGFQQTVLARELTLDEISDIHRQVPDMPLEVFIHGAICVSYNGQCYASQYCFGRSANRGECAQFCRLPFDLQDADGQIIKQGHLLSLRDMNRSQELESLLDAGAVSLKIEGRLKDTAYVKNVVAYYRQLLDKIFLHRKEYARSSQGTHTISFTPRPEASFNRGFTNYFLKGRTADLCNPITPKSMGEYVGYVKEIRQGAIIVAGVKQFANGDGICYVDVKGHLQGFRVNRVNNNKLYPLQMPRGLKDKTRLYRNFDQAFEQELSKPTATRKLPLHWTLKETTNGFSLNGMEFECEHQLARSPQREHIERQLARLGDTPYESTGVDFEMSADWFIPASTLAEWRRCVVEQQSMQRLKPIYAKNEVNLCIDSPYAKQHLDYTANVANHLAREFYLEQGATQVDVAMEVAGNKVGEKPLLMTCRYCIRYQLGYCSKQGKAPFREPLFLHSADGRMFRLHFDCKQCKMEVYAE